MNQYSFNFEGARYLKSLPNLQLKKLILKTSSCKLISEQSKEKKQLLLHQLIIIQAFNLKQDLFLNIKHLVLKKVKSILLSSMSLI